MSEFARCPTCCANRTPGAICPCSYVHPWREPSDRDALTAGRWMVTKGGIQRWAPVEAEIAAYRKKRGLPDARPPEKTPACKAAGCTNKRRSYGLCGKHYRLTQTPEAMRMAEIIKEVYA